MTERWAREALRYGLLEAEENDKTKKLRTIFEWSHASSFCLWMWAPWLVQL